MNTISIAPPHFPTITAKALGFAMAGIVVTFGLFSLMSFLIKQDITVIPEAPVFTLPNFTMVTQPIKVIEKAKLPALPESVDRPPQAPKTISDAKHSGFSEIAVEVPAIAPLLFSSEINSSGITNADVAPIVRVEPQYPMSALRQGIEGWVRLSFSINPLGQVTDINVVEAQPKRVFDRAASRALKRWKYRPKIENGQPVSQSGLSVQLDFNMQK